ncbi:MAG: histidinol dehydrogenase [Fimbriimonadaceae bacterium]
MPFCSVVPFGDPALLKWYDRRPAFDARLVQGVAQTIDDVSRNGAEAVLRHTRQYDAPDLQTLFIRPSELPNPRTPEPLLTAIHRVTEFHELQLEALTEGMAATGDGWGWRTFSNDERESGMVGQRLLPVRSAGIYVPGGKADYPSSVIMNVVPAKVAGVERIVVATPPDLNGEVSDAVLSVCHDLGVKTLIKAGGASAIAAMALGVEELERVDVIAGPGNKYVNEAKRQLWGAVGLDCYAGPSEVCVFADDEANAEFAAADLVCQVEHAEDNVGVLVTLSLAKAKEVLSAAEAMLAGQPTEGRVRESLRENGVAIVCKTTGEAIEAINKLAPEHLALHCEDPPAVLSEIKNAGAVMMGPWTAQSVADYCEGPSHTLPTSGAARFASPVNVLTFLRLQTVSMLEQEDAQDLATTAQGIADLEWLPLHAHAAQVRTNPKTP